MEAQYVSSLVILSVETRNAIASFNEMGVYENLAALVPTIFDLKSVFSQPVECSFLSKQGCWHQKNRKQTQSSVKRTSFEIITIGSDKIYLCDSNCKATQLTGRCHRAVTSNQAFITFLCPLLQGINVSLRDRNPKAIAIRNSSEPNSFPTPPFPSPSIWKF